MEIKKGKRMYVRTGSVLVAVLAVSGCAIDLENKTFSHSVVDVAITGEWTPANITLGAAQVFTRATLLNDRRREQRFIESLIKHSRNQKFEPQLQRDLRTLSIATAQVGISSDPTARGNFQREKEISELKQEVNKRRLQAEIARLDAQIERIQNQAAAEVPPPVGNVDLTQNALQPPSGAPSAEVTALVTELKSKLTEILNDVGGGADGRVAASDAAASPEDRFRDLQAYRGLLRAYEASNALDDTHDLGGNTFYRVQFRATVSPETIRDRFGVIEVVPTDPTHTMTEEPIAQLYWAWLAHVTRRLNQPRADNLAMRNLLANYANLFGIITTQLPSDAGSVHMAVPPASEKVLQDAIKDLDGSRRPERKAKQLSKGITLLERSTDLTLLEKSTDLVGHGDKCPLLPEGPDLNRRNVERLFPLYDQLARAYIQHFPALALILTNLSHLSHSGEISIPSANIDELSKHHGEAFDRAQEYVRTRIHAIKRINVTKKPPILPAQLFACENHFRPMAFNIVESVPPKFKELLTKDKDQRMRVLEVSPAERAQRVSTLASAAASLQTALSIAAALPTAGIGINAGLGNLKSEIGKIEAHERVPLVVGFYEAGHYEHVPKETSPRLVVRLPRFGWILGPPLGPDLGDSQIKHSQVLKSHEVQVDLSVPAWWPSVKLSVLTAWAGPLGESVAKSCAACVKKTFTVALPRSDSDMDALTQFLLSKLSINLAVGSDSPRIVRVSPSTIDRNNGQVALIVQGSGLWRGEEVYVFGVRQTEVKVLPDMSGLAVSLNPASLPRLNPEVDIMPLAVYTRAGKAVYQGLKLIEPQAASASALAVVSVLPYHIDNKLLELRPRSGSFPLGASPKFAFRPSVKGQNYKFEEERATLTASRSVASATFNWAGGVTMVSGDTLAVRYLYQPDIDTAAIWSEEVYLVYYKDDAAAAAKFEDEDVKANSLAVVGVRLQLPERAAEAFPLIFDADTKIKATAGTAELLRSGKALEVTVTPPNGGFAPGKIMLEFTNPKAGTDTLPKVRGTLTVK